MIIKAKISYSAAMYYFGYNNIYTIKNLENNNFLWYNTPEFYP